MDANTQRMPLILIHDAYSHFSLKLIQLINQILLRKSIFFLHFSTIFIINITSAYLLLNFQIYFSKLSANLCTIFIPFIYWFHHQYSIMLQYTLFSIFVPLLYAQFSEYYTIPYATNFDYRLALSPDGRYLIRANNNQSVILQQKVNLTYHFVQEFIYSTQINNFYITGLNDYLLITRNQGTDVYKLTNGLYSIVQTITQLNMDSSTMTEDFNNIILKPTTNQPSTLHNYVLSSGTYILVQSLADATNDIVDIKCTNDSAYLISGGREQILRIYSRNPSTYRYTLTTQFSTVTRIIEMGIMNDLQRIMIGGIDLNLYIYDQINPMVFTLSQSLPISSAPINRVFVTENWKFIISHSVNSATIHIFTSGNNPLGSFTSFQDIVNPFPAPYSDIAFNKYGMQMIYSTRTTVIETYYASQCYVSDCAICSSPSICQQCQINYSLSSNTCVYTPPPAPIIPIPPSPINSTPSTQISNSSTSMANYCVDLIENNNICIQFCVEGCETCETTAQNCSSCIDRYKLDGNTCILESEQISILGIMYSIGSFFRVKKIKSMFFILDDLWLYQFHKQEYTETPKQIFDIIHIIESMKDSILNFNWGTFLQDIKQSLISFKEVSLLKYLLISRKDDSVLNNQIDYFFKSIPVAIVLFLLIKLLFCLLFNYEISKYLRSMSFNGFFFVMILQGQIQKLSFFGFRNFHYIFAYDYRYRLTSIFVILLMYALFFYGIAAYSMFLIQYKKLSKYFVDNLPGQILGAMHMTVVYGIRPFVKGAVHCLIIQNTQMQLLILGLIDALVLFFTCYIQLRYQAFKNKLSFSFLCLYFGITSFINFLFWLNLVLKKDQLLMRQIDQMTVAILVVRVLCPLFQLLFSVMDLHKDNKSKENQNKSKTQQVKSEKENNSWIGSKQKEANILNQQDGKKKKLPVVYHLILIEKIYSEDSRDEEQVEEVAL